MAFLKNLLTLSEPVKTNQVHVHQPPQRRKSVTPESSETEYLSEEIEEETGCTVDTDGRVCDSTTLNLYRDFAVPVKKLRRREIKWMHMIKSWDKFVSRHYEKVKIFELTILCGSSFWTISPNFISLSKLGNELQFFQCFSLHHQPAPPIYKSRATWDLKYSYLVTYCA